MKGCVQGKAAMPDPTELSLRLTQGDRCFHFATLRTNCCECDCYKTLETLLDASPASAAVSPVLRPPHRFNYLQKFSELVWVNPSLPQTAYTHSKEFIKKTFGVDPNASQAT